MSMPQAPERNIFTPSALNRLVRDLLADALPRLWVEGEISNFTRAASGHMYFSLKDSSAQIRCAMFRGANSKLRFRPANGMQVLVRGNIGLYEARGDYQLIADGMEEAGEGALLREFEALKARLDAEGLFAASRKRALPAMPARIGVLSSTKGAALHDVLSVLSRRFPLVEVEVLPIPVQGREAPAAILAMLDAAYRARRHEVLLLTRGGGSLEDLWAFNDEALARRIAESPMPLVSAIGHEVDFTLADFAADLRAATPSAAAELLVPDQRDLARLLDRHHQRLQRHTEQMLAGGAQHLDHLLARLRTVGPAPRIKRGHEVLTAHRRALHGVIARQVRSLDERSGHLNARLRAQHPRQRLARAADRLADLRARLWRLQPAIGARRELQRLHATLRAASPTGRLRLARQRTMQAGNRIAPNMREHARRKRQQLEGLGRSLHAFSPLGTLERGYAILLAGDGTVLRSVESIAQGDRIRARLVDGDVPLERPAD